MAIPTDGLVFYAPLAEDKATAETGQTLNYTGNFQFNIVSGIPCAVFSGEEKISVDNSNCFSGDFSISCWFRLTTPMAEGVVNAAVFVFGTSENWLTIRVNANGIFMNLGGQNNTKQITVDTVTFNNITVTYSSSKLSIYINGLLDSQVNLDSLPNSSTFLIGDSGYSDWFTGEIASFRIYSKVLNTSEISALYNEFNEDSGGSDSGNTGFLIDGLFLSSSKPKLGQKGLLLDNKYFLPLVEGSGGAAEYYRCASVDTSAKTWTGYRAVLNDGVYTFENTVTTGLSYTSVTPKAGSIYSSDTLASVEALWDGIPTDGLVLYAPLNMSSICTKTGQTITETDISYAWDEILNGNAAVFNGSSARINLSTENIPSSGSPRTVSFWCCPSANSGAHIFNIGGQADRFLFFMENTGIFYLKAGSNEISSGVSAEIGKWYHICIKVDDSNSSLYINSSLAGSTGKPDNSNSNFYLGCGYNQESFFSGKMASLRIYNTALDSEKVELLYREHQISET